MMKHLQQVLTVTDPLLELLDKAEDHFIGYAYEIDYGHLCFPGSRLLCKMRCSTPLPKSGDFPLPTLKNLLG